MTRINCAITTTTLHGHYNAYAVYKKKDGTFKVYCHTFTDSTIYDHYMHDWSDARCQREALKMARLDHFPVVLDNHPTYASLCRAFH